MATILFSRARSRSRRRKEQQAKLQSGDGEEGDEEKKAKNKKNFKSRIRILGKTALMFSGSSKSDKSKESSMEYAPE